MSQTQLPQDSVQSKDSQQPLLRAENLRVVLERNEVLRGISFELLPGEVLAVLGPNGGGKTTLLRALTGELALASGRVWLGSADVTGFPLWRRARLGLGYLPQTPSVLWDLSVADNIRTFQVLSRAQSSPVNESAERFGLEKQLNVPAKQLSGDERRRLELLRMLTPEPNVLVCDEPFSGISPEGVEQVRAELRAAARAGSAVVIADHRVEEVLAVCSRAVLLVDGRLAVEADPGRFREHPDVARRYLT